MKIENHATVIIPCCSYVYSSLAIGTVTSLLIGVE